MDYVRTKQAHEIDMETLRLSKAEAAAKANAANLANARTEAMEMAKAIQAGPRPAQKLKAKDAEGLYEQDLDKETRIKTKDEKLKAVRIFLADSKVECIDDITRPHVADWIRSLKDKDGNGDRRGCPEFCVNGV